MLVFETVLGTLNTCGIFLIIKKIHTTPTGMSADPFVAINERLDTEVEPINFQMTSSKFVRRSHTIIDHVFSEIFGHYLRTGREQQGTATYEGERLTRTKRKVFIPLRFSFFTCN